jgi:hypothetical protein
MSTAGIALVTAGFFSAANLIRTASVPQRIGRTVRIVRANFKSTQK